MDEQKGKSPIESAAAAAGYAKTAIKVGKSMAGAAKGAAAGPYGAIAGVLFEHRETVAKAIIAAIGLLVVPILFLLMLPSMIFGDLSSTEVNTSFKDISQIESNISEAENTALTILRERHAAVLKEIQTEIDSHGSKTRHEIVDPFQDNIFLDIASMICWYSASEEDFKEININNFKKILEKHKSNLYSYKTEIWIDTEYDEETDTYISITCYRYTVEYVGDDYFPTTVFELDETQLQIANDFSGNLSLFLAKQYNVATNGTHTAINEALPNYSFSSSTSGFGQPLKGVDWRSCVTSEFGDSRSQFNDVHTGLDMSPESKVGRPVIAVKDGIVIFTRRSEGGYGNHVAVFHGNGLVTMYAHCYTLSVQEGQTVSQGQQLGTMGSTGKSTGPHLHFEVIQDGELKNPREYLP